jgi:fused signal recognition particle receptor
VPTSRPAPTVGTAGSTPEAGLRKTGSSIAQVFTGTRIDDALYEDLESALLMADTGVRPRSSCWPT